MRTKQRQLKLAFVVLLAIMFIAASSAIAIKPTSADEEALTIKIVAGDNGEVSSSGQTTSTDSREITVTVEPNGKLDIVATANDKYILQYWSTKSGNTDSSVSVKSTDTFTYKELSDKGITELYANFVGAISEESDKYDSSKIQINYDDRLGSVYFFIGKKGTAEEDIEAHGLLIENNVPTILPFEYNKRTIQDTVLETINASSVTFAAIPKKDVDSTLEVGEKTSGHFVSWSAEFSNEFNGTYYKQELPRYLNSSSLGTSTNPDGTYKISGSGTSVGAMWYASSVSGGAKYTISSRQYANDNNNQWFYNEFDAHFKYGQQLYVKPQTISALFEETEILPQMRIEPMIDGQPESETVTSDRETTIYLPYGGANNTVGVKINALSLAKEQKYSIAVQKERNLTDGSFTEDHSINCEKIEDEYMFTVTNIKVNCNILITADYGDGYYVEPIVIRVRFESDRENGLEEIISSDSEEMTVEKVADEKEWYLDPQFNGIGTLAYTSGISYPDEYYQGSTTEIAQLHFQVTGSGVFTFEFYLDGMAVNGDSDSYAVYKTGSQLSKSDKYTTKKDNIVPLAKGMAEASGGYVYAPSTILDTESVKSLAGYGDWRVATFSIEGDEAQVTDIYVAHVVEGDYFAVDWAKKHTVMSVRRVAFYQGQSNVSWGIYDNEDNSKDGYGTITATVNGEAQESQPYLTDSGTRIQFTVEPTSDYKFYGWSDGKNLLSTAETFDYTVRGKKDGASTTNIYAVITPSDDNSTYAYRNGGMFFLESELQDALNADNNPQIFILKSLSTSESVTIPSNVELILPFNEAGEYYVDGTPTTASDTFSWKSAKYSTPTYTFTYSGTMTVNGTFRIGGVVNFPSQSYSGLTSGAYSQFVNNGTVNVNNGGLMDIYGLVTGTGSIKVGANGKLAQPFLILDFAGGTNTAGLYFQRQTPFNRYAMVNVQCEGGITVDYMGELLGHASLYAMGGINTATAAVISYKTSDRDESVRGLVTLTQGGSVKVVYKEEAGVTTTAANGTTNIGKTKLTFNGGATANHMSLNVGIEISTEDVDAFAVPYNFEIVLQSGTFSLDGNFKLMPGSVMKVEQDATLNVNANFYVHDGLVQSTMSGKGYPTAEQLKGASYNSNATFIVNGTLNIGERATFIGVVQTEDTTGKATIVTHSGATLTGKVVDGGKTEYDCNYSAYDSSARVWDIAHEKLSTLEAGKTYKSAVVSELATFTLPSVAVKYESVNYGTSLSSGTPHDEAKHSTDGNTMEVTGLKGGFAADHVGHTYDWTKKEGDAVPTAETPIQKIERQCEEIGCNEKEERHVLYMAALSAEYKGRMFTEDEVKELIKSAYEKGTDYNDSIFDFANFRIDNILNKGTYNVNVTLNSGYFFLKEDSYTAEAQLTLTVTAHALNKADITLPNEGEELKLTYKGAEYTKDDIKRMITVKIGEDKVPDTEYDIEITGEGTTNADSTFQVKIKPAEGKDNLTGEVTITATIAKKAAEVKAQSKSSAEGDDAVALTFELTGFVNNDGETLRSAIEIKLQKEGSDVSLDEVKNEKANTELDIVVALKANAGDEITNILKNYNVTYTNSTYLVTESVYKGIQLSGDTLEYNGEARELTVTGLDGKEGISVVYEYSLGQEPVEKENVKKPGEYTVKATLSKAGSNSLTLTATLTIEKKEIEVTMEAETVTYNGNAQEYSKELELTGIIGSEQVTLTTSISNAINAGNYSVTVTLGGEDKDNYKVKINGTEISATLQVSDMLKIEKKALTVKAVDKTSKYGETPVALEATVEGAVEKDNVKADITLKVLKGEGEITLGVTTAAGEYVISVSLDDRWNANYTVTCTNGAYTVTKREITVTVAAQRDVYDYGKTYPFDAEKWEVTDGDGFVNEETEDILGVNLALEREITGAGTYRILATYNDNGNYEVTFVDGEYTVAKKDISDEAMITLLAGGTSAQDGKLSVSYNGSEIVFEAHVFVMEGEELRELMGGAKLSMEEITGVGEYEVTVEIDNENYSGSKTFAVTVVNEKGYTAKLIEALADLAELKGKLGEKLSDSDYGTIKGMYDIMSGLSDEERLSGRSELTEYEEILDEWNEAIEVSEAEITTAKSVADSFVGYLYKIVAAVSALAEMAYIAIKGVKRV